MGFYDDQVVPRIVNLTCGSSWVGPLRERACAGLSGEVVEVGFGSGYNVPFYPAQVSRIAAVEPSDVGWKLAAKQLRAAKVPIDRAGLDGEQLPFDDHSFDAALSTWTMCTIPNIGAALAQLRRVLKPGATLHFLEHGSAPDQSVRTWQHRLDPLQQRLFGGCHLTRPIAELLEAGGYTVTAIERFYQPAMPKPIASIWLGTATSP